MTSNWLAPANNILLSGSVVTPAARLAHFLNP